METLWALENGIHAIFCGVCGATFHLPPPYKRKSYLCSKVCKKTKRIELSGGEAALRGKDWKMEIGYVKEVFKFELNKL